MRASIPAAEASSRHHYCGAHVVAKRSVPSEMAGELRSIWGKCWGSKGRNGDIDTRSGPVRGGAMAEPGFNKSDH